MTTAVGIREFRAGLADFVAAREPVAVMRHGVIVGWFIPTPPDHGQEVASLRSAAARLDELLSAQGFDVEELVADYQATRRTK